MQKTLVCVANRIQEGVALAQEAERAGFDAIWATEFHNRDVYTWMAAMGQGTTSMAIGSGIAYAFVRPPVLVAAAAADVDELIGGRVLLGLGTGTQRMNESWYGLPFAKPAARMAEAVELIRETWDAAAGPRLQHHGQFWEVDIPIYVAGVNALMARTAGETADGYIGHPLSSRRYMREVTHPAVQRGLQRAGRPRQAITMANYIICAIHENPEQARHEAALQIAFHATVYTYRGIFELHGFAAEREAIRAAFDRRDVPAMLGAVPAQMVDECAIAGTPEQCLEQFKRYEGLLDMAMFFAPSFAIPAARVLENQRAILATFGTGTA